MNIQFSVRFYDIYRIVSEEAQKVLNPIIDADLKDEFMDYMEFKTASWDEVSLEQVSRFIEREKSTIYEEIGLEE